jgi:hypothetical protein
MNSQDKYNELKKVNRLGEHYKTSSIDVIDIAKLYDLNFNKGNAVKYLCRAGKKDNEIKDLEKALDYINREIEYLKGNNTHKPYIYNYIPKN